jgi:hypothetical protein
LAPPWERRVHAVSRVGMSLTVIPALDRARAKLAP